MKRYLILLLLIFSNFVNSNEPKLYWYGNDNFGDCLSQVVVERIIEKEVTKSNLQENYPVVFAIGSILRKARNNDIVWGSGFRHYRPGDIKKGIKLDVRAVRGPKTREILLSLGIDCPEVYGDPALLMPKLFPELKKQTPIYDYLIIPHISDRIKFQNFQNVVNTNEKPNIIIDKILKSKFVISSSLHGIIVAEAFGIPARLMKPDKEPMLKYIDYYESTGRPNFKYANTLEEALKMKGEPPININLQPLLDSFPYEYFCDDSLS